MGAEGRTYVSYTKSPSHHAILFPNRFHLMSPAVNQLFYTDNFGHSDPEYISLGMDDAPVLQGRTPVQVYSDFMQAFAQTFRSYLGSVITLVEVRV